MGEQFAKPFGPLEIPVLEICEFAWVRNMINDHPLDWGQKEMIFLKVAHHKFVKIVNS